jgi:hypothetical protein
MDGILLPYSDSDYSYYHGNMMMDIHMDNNMNI